MKKVTLLTTLLILIAFFACNKKELSNEINDESHLEVDDNYSQENEITPINLAVEIKDGRMVFENHSTLISTLESLSDYNIESYKDWENELAFTSLYSEFNRLDELDKAEVKIELENGRSNHFFQEGEFGIEPILHSLYISKVLNAEGLFQVGDYIGSIGVGLNIWTTEDNINKLKEILESRVLPLDKSNFIIIDDSYFANNSVLSVETRASYGTTCPKVSYYLSPTVSYSKPNSNRKIKGRWSFQPITTPRANGGTFDYTVTFNSVSQSHRGCCKYKTIHYYSYDLIVEQFNGVGGSISHIASGNSGSTKKEWQRSKTLASYSNVTS